MLTLTYTNKRTHKSRRINLNRLFCSLLVLTLIITFTACITDFMRFPDKYITTWKYQLKNEIASGDMEAIAYYNNNYISKVVYLYGENAESESDFLNLAHGNGYFIEK